MWHTAVMPDKPKPKPPTSEAIRQDVATYVAAGADESVQRVITSVHGLARQAQAVVRPPAR